MGLRHRGREAALRLLYQVELTGDASEAALVRACEELPPRLASSRAFAVELARAALEHKGRIDSYINAAAAHWDVDRMSRIDLCILRLAVGELLAFPDTPREVVLDEAIELARAYSDVDARAFVNGVLDRVVRDLANSLEE